MDFALVFKFLIETFKRENIDFALMGGFALQTAGVTRTTRDIDLLIMSQDAGKIKDMMLTHGYELIYESKDILNFTGKKFELGRVDFLLAYRKYATAMLKRAEEIPVMEGRFKIKVLKVEDLIGLKVQASSNDSGRLKQDMADIIALVKSSYLKLDMELLKEYFALFNRQEELNNIIKDIKNAE